MQAVELRERALAAVMSARDFIATHPAPSAANQKELDAQYAAAIRAIAAFEAASGTTRPAVISEDAGERLMQLNAWLGGPGTTGAGMGNGIPFPGGASNGPAGAFSWGQAFIEARAARGGGGIGFQAAVLEPGSTAVTIPLRPDPITDPRRARFVFELLAEQDAPTGQFSWMLQNLRDLNAAVVAPGARKPTSLFKMERQDGRTEVIGHISEPIDRFSVEDAPMLRQFIDAELRLGVDLALDAVVVDALIAAATAGEATLDLSGIRTAMTALQLLELQASAVVINPTDWQTVEEEAVATFAANSNAPAATEAMARRLYGVPVVVSNGIDAGQAIVGDFSASQPASADLYVTGGLRIDISDAPPREIGAEWVSAFATNELVWRAERRAAVAVGRPAGFILVGTEGS